jgi:hypothetical protein
VNGMTEGEIRLQISLSHVYLEMARAVFRPVQSSQVAHRAPPDYPTMFGLLSVTILYSYLAIESFINYHFCTIYERAAKSHQACEKLTKLHPDDEIIPDYDDFFKQHGNTPLQAIRLELKEKIKSVCSAYSIPQIYEQDPQLWQDFCDILKPSRDFLVHAVPEPQIFETHMRRLVEQTTAGKYVEIATGIIKYFYEQHDKEPPDWLSENQLIQFYAVRPDTDAENATHR